MLKLGANACKGVLVGESNAGALPAIGSRVTSNRNGVSYKVMGHDGGRVIVDNGKGGLQLPISDIRR